MPLAGVNKAWVEIARLDYQDLVLSRNAVDKVTATAKAISSTVRLRGLLSGGPPSPADPRQKQRTEG